MDYSIEHIAASQLGLITRAQLLQLGISRRMIGYLASIGRLSSIHPGVFRVRHAPPSFKQSLLAALFGAGVLPEEKSTIRAVVSHRAAAAVFGIEGVAAQMPELTIPESRRVHLRGVIVHRTRNLEPDDCRAQGLLRLTTPARTLVDLTDEIEMVHLDKAMDDALSRRLTTIAEIRAAIRRRGKRRGRGIRGIDAVKVLARSKDPSGSWY